MKQVKRQAKRLPVPDTPTLELKLDDGRVITLDKIVGPVKTPGVSPTSTYVGQGFAVIITRSVHAQFGQLLHASISHGSGQLPPWYVMKALKQAIFPDNVGAILPMPEVTRYVNLVECLHIVQMPSEWGSL